jgi:hypothetical protein
VPCITTAVAERRLGAGRVMVTKIIAIVTLNLVAGPRGLTLMGNPALIQSFFLPVFNLESEVIFCHLAYLPIFLWGTSPLAILRLTKFLVSDLVTERASISSLGP